MVCREYVALARRIGIVQLASCTVRRIQQSCTFQSGKDEHTEHAEGFYRIPCRKPQATSWTELKDGQGTAGWTGIHAFIQRFLKGRFTTWRPTNSSGKHARIRRYCDEGKGTETKIAREWRNTEV
jgi:hypothetical protein